MNGDRILKFLNIHQLPTYGFMEAALHGINHRDRERCKNQFPRCPSTSDALIDQLNERPGGVNAVINDVSSALRPNRPQGFQLQRLPFSTPLTNKEIETFSIDFEIRETFKSRSSSLNL